MDNEKRQLYDETGEIDDGIDIDLNNTYNYYRDIYPTITKDDIESFSTKYRNSQMEIDDLVDYYNENNGDLVHILEWIPLSTNSDKERFVKIYEDLINQKVIKKNKAFTSTKNKIKNIAEDGAEEVEQETKKMDDLYSQILAKKTKRDDAFDAMSK
jgi:DnaJ family protein C protein 9